MSAGSSLRGSREIHLRSGDVKQGGEESQYQCSDGPVMGRLLLQATGAQSRGKTFEDYGEPSAGIYSLPLFSHCLKVVSLRH